MGSRRLFKPVAKCGPGKYYYYGFEENVESIWVKTMHYCLPALKACPGGSVEAMLWWRICIVTNVAGTPNYSRIRNWFRGGGSFGTLLDEDGDGKGWSRRADWREMGMIRTN